jgi:alkanesulfonate monooxygenase SsuD/methylene tetrahydromethanopterin reductase-like flavin-dependent oxidoreductase (luciferase family)/FAD/FMN-containing dehydrogenase
MTDYGHELQFGAFITPRNQPPEYAVALAQLSERAGLDLVTFQDHPYQPAFLDTWTLLSWVAARTDKIHVAANVHSLPMRPPAVLARAAASLDLLSKGRFELGLGAGGFWDAIAAMGGPRRSPGEAVEAVGEAIDIIRAVWNGSMRGGVRVAGKHYQVVGAKRGPEPAHDIAIWVGALKPRMLRLIGEKADGWLPSLFYLQDGDLERGNSVIDEAATASGRDPREIRRLLNISGGFAPDSDGFLKGSPEAWVEQLLPLVLDLGVSTFILASDDARSIETFGQEVAPALRARVEQERRTAGTATGEVVRGPKARALRRSGIDYASVPSALRQLAVEPGDRDYAKLRSSYVRAGSPGLVLRPETASAVAEALGFARRQEVPFAIRSGGHSLTGASTNDGGLVINLARLNHVEVLDAATGRIRVGPGARWSHVAQALLPHGLAISSGDYGGVGVGGLATAGGIGFLGRKHGLTIDHMIAADVVLGDGTLVHASTEEHADLFWALRGAGGNLGIVTSFELLARPVGDVIFLRLVYDAADLAGLLERWGEVVEGAPRELTSFLYAARRRYAQIMVVFAGSDADADDALAPLLDVAPVVDQQALHVPYASIMHADDAPYYGSGDAMLLSNGFASHLTAELSGEVADALRSGTSRWLAIRAVGGAVNDVDPSATAFAHRRQSFSISDIGSRKTDYVRYWDRLRRHTSGLYINFESDARPQRLHDAYPGATLQRLRRVKAAYDPDNVFNQAFPIPMVRAG